MPVTGTRPPVPRAVSAPEWRSTEWAVTSSLVEVVLPTRNEADNIELLIHRLRDAMTGQAHWGVLVVDDSDDDTPAKARAMAEEGHPVRVLHRPRGFRGGGLAGAVMTALANTQAPLVVVMDADLQHPPEVVPLLVGPLLDGRCDIVVATRYRGCGGSAGLDGLWRRLVSRASRRAVHLVFPRLVNVSDPCGGLFAMRREVVGSGTLTPKGFKILLEILVKGSWSRLEEVPYMFAARAGGRSNATLRQGRFFLQQLARLWWSSRHLSPHPPAVIDIRDGAVLRGGRAGGFWRHALGLQLHTLVARLRRVSSRRDVR